MRNIDNIWSINEQKLTPLRRRGLHLLKRISLAAECMFKDNIMSFASALTYNTMLAAVPVLAIVFAISRGFGFDSFVEERLRQSLDLSPEVADTLMDFVNSYLQHTRGGVFIGVGLVFLLYSLLSLTTNIETAFNTIWHVRNSRNIYRKITDYLSVFLLLPFAIIILSGFNIFLISFRGFLPDYQIVNSTLARLFELSPVLLMSIAFTLLYKYMPNTQVRFKHTLWPGVMAGTLFMVTEYLYVHYQIKLSSYNAIYGSFAALPLFMLWLQISWSICLLGGLLCYANQSLENYAIERVSYDLSRRCRDTICLLLMSRICKRFASGSVPYTERSLAQEIHLPETLVRILLSELVNMQLLVETRSETSSITHYLPAIDISRLSIKKVLKHIDRYGSETPRSVWQLSAPEWDKLRQLRYNDEDALLYEI